MSRAFSAHSLVAGLEKASQVASRSGDWHPINREQDMLLEVAANYPFNQFPPLPTSVIASLVAREITEFYRQRGFDISFPELKPREIGIGTLLDILVDWQVPGDRESIYYLNRRYPAAYLKKGLFVIRSREHNYPHAVIGTKNGYMVGMTALDEDLNEWEMLDLASRVQLSTNPTDYNGLIFPCTSLEASTDASWMTGLFAPNPYGGMVVTQVFQRDRLRMNEYGARAQSASGMTVQMLGARDEHPLVIDRPFMVWFSQSMNHTPVFVARVTPEHWSDPGDIRS